MCQFWEHTCGHRTQTACDLPRKARDPNATPEPVILRPGPAEQENDPDNKPYRERERRGRPSTPPGKYKAYYGFYFDMSRYSRIVKPDYCYGFEGEPKAAHCPCYACVLVDVGEKIKIEAEEMRKRAEHDDQTKRLVDATDAVVSGRGPLLRLPVGGTGDARGDERNSIGGADGGGAGGGGVGLVRSSNSSNSISAGGGGAWYVGGGGMGGPPLPPLPPTLPYGPYGGQGMAMMGVGGGMGGVVFGGGYASGQSAGFDQSVAHPAVAYHSYVDQNAAAAGAAAAYPAYYYNHNHDQRTSN